MGLDMYLYAERYVWSEEKERSEILKVLKVDKEVVGEIVGLRVQLPVGYWRKANSIHNWFVENVQEGVDDCKEYRVTTLHLDKLRDTCKTAIASKQPNHLPAIEGFFFGSTEYDDTYWQTLKRTVKIMDNCLALSAREDMRSPNFSYRASW